MATIEQRARAGGATSRYRVRPGDLVAIVVFNALLIVGMWFRHGGLNALGSTGAKLSAAGQLTALIGTYSVLIQILLMSRSPFIEQLFGMDRLAHWHRVLGYTVTGFILGHVVFTTAGYAIGDHTSFVSEMKTLITRYPDVLAAVVGTALLVMVVVSSIRAARRRLKYETWHLIHFYAYLAVALSFGHALAVGSDFSGDALARAYWIFLYAITAAVVLWFRFGHPVALSIRHRLRVANVVTGGPGVVSVYVTGRDLDRLRTRAGQFFKWRFLTGRGGWPAHPFSLSAAPNGRFLRLTVKEIGDGTGKIAGLKLGTRVAIEGPYGLFTTMRRTRSRVLLIAGGIGISPIRALLEEIPLGKAHVALLYRASSWDDVIFKKELDELVRGRGVAHYLVGRRADLPRDPLSAEEISRLVPDVRKRDVFVCGPAGMMTELHASLEALRVPANQIHYERFALL